MAESSNDRLDLALNLTLREMEIYAASYQGIRNNVQTIVTLAATIDAVLIAGVFSRPILPSTASLVVALAMVGLLLIGGVLVMWIAPSALSWPDGYAIGMEASGSAADGKRSLVIKMQAELVRVRNRLKWYQRLLFPLVLILILSVGSWVWLLRTPNSPTPHPTTTTTTLTRSAIPSTQAFYSEML
jgi:hypothetical protein